MRRIVLIAALLIPTTASAHFNLVTPEAKYTQSSLGDPQKQGPCGPTGDGGTATNKVTTVMAGSMLTISLKETVFHPGHYRVSIAQDEAGLPPVPTVTTGTSQCGSVPIAQSPTLPVLADGVLVHTATLSGTQTTQVQLPAGMTCNNCVVQVVEFMSNHAAPCFYYHCAMVNVTTSGTAPDAGMTGGDAGTDPGGGGGGCNSGRGAGSCVVLVMLALLLRRRR
jgi:hypothetical protein